MAHLYHLTAYLDSEAFRFNNRAVKDADRFEMVVNQIDGKRLTYKQLISANPPEGVLSSEVGGNDGLAN